MNPFQPRMTARAKVAKAAGQVPSTFVVTGIGASTPNPNSYSGVSENPPPGFMGAFTQLPAGPLDLSSVTRLATPSTPAPVPGPAPTGLAAVPTWAWILGAVVLVGGVYMVSKK